jgi:ABC-2 type transport system ATP-binding protein
MSLEAIGLSKIYGSQKAVDGVSFEAPTGKITGFLGPNGAGKSTTMKIATGFVLPSEGTVRVDGLDVVKNPLSVKKRTGYLPEHNPLYLDMYVREFLRFVGRAYRIPRLAYRVEEMIEMIGLTRERNKKIGTLSKGYRQRVGLAHAMIHDPSVLILDEPTTGLDTNQIVEIRNIIKDVSADKTVILSTHIMQEVDALCDKVVIIDKGRIVADDSVAVLKTVATERKAFRLRFEEEVDISLFDNYEVEKENTRQMVVYSDAANLRADLLQLISSHDLPLESISTAETQSLEDVFRKLTGKPEKETES